MTMLRLLIAMARRGEQLVGLCAGGRRGALVVKPSGYGARRPVVSWPVWRSGCCWNRYPRPAAQKWKAWPRYSLYSVSLRSRNAFAITETELKVMAALAMMGLKRSPNTG
jgi:hypothetical protein